MGDSNNTKVPLRVGIVGAGLMGRWHADAIKKAGGRLLGVADLHADAARQLARMYRPAESFREAEVMLARLTLDILHICTPVLSHEMLADLAIDRGINVLVEKPVTLEAQGTRRLLERAASHGVLLCPVHQFVFQDGVLKAKRLLPSIGRLVHVEGVFSSAGAVGHPRTQLDPIVSDILPHPLSLMQVLLPTGKIPEKWAILRPCPGEFRAWAEVSGITLSLWISMHARPTECAFKMLGTEGTIHIDLFHGYAFREPGKVSRMRKIVLPFDHAVRRFSAATLNLALRAIRGEPAYPGLRRLVWLFYESVRNKAQGPISPEATASVAHLRDGLMQERSVDRYQCQAG